MRRLSMPCVLLALVARPLAAQDPPNTAVTLPGQIEGQLLDAETERPIEGAAVRILDLDVPEQITGSVGQFRFAELPRGVYAIEITHIAYGTGTHLINVPEGETVDFLGRIRPSAIELEPLVIEVDVRVSRLDQVGFLRRRKRGGGRFFSGEEADAWRITELLYRVPGMSIEQRGRSVVDRRVVFRRGRLACTPAIYLDGRVQRWAGGDVESVVVGLDIEGIEIYRGLETPAEFVSNVSTRACGAIVIWTRKQ